MFKDNRYRDLTIHNLKNDLIAGITVGVVAIPLGMAFAIASGVKPEYGLYTTVIAGLLVALLGGSKFQIAGPTGAFIPILLAIVLQYGYEDLLIAGFLAGLMLVIMGFFKIGNLIKFIPRSVTIGFTSGIAVIIFSGQIEGFLGLTGIEKKEYFHENMFQIILNFGTINFYAILLGIIGLLMIIFIPKFFPRVPILLFALIIPTIISFFLFPDNVATIGTVFGGISQKLPSLMLPDLSFEKLLYLWQPAFVIAMLGGIESLLSAVVADGMTGKQHNSNRELVGQGIANMVTPLFGGIPATGAIARTATNIRAGAVSPVSGVVQAAFVLLTILLFAPYASHIPLASMAPILMIVAYNMSERKAFWHILKLRTADSLVLLATFLLTVFVNLTVAVPVGLVLAMILFIRQMSGVLAVENIKAENHHEITTPEKICPQIASFTVHGPLFFGAADRFETLINKTIHERPAVLILKMRHVSTIDVTGEANLANLVRDFQKMGGTVLIAELNNHPLEMLEKSGLFDIIGPNNFFKTTTAAINSALELISVQNCVYCSEKGYKTCQTYVEIKSE